MTYLVKEINADGKIVQSSYDGKSKDDIVRKIRSKGHSPISITQQEEKNSSSVGSIQIMKKKVSLKDLSIFCRQMSTMLRAGMPLVESLNVIKDQSDHPRIRDAAEDMMNKVQMGEVLSTTMKMHRDIFPPILINMIETGELSGNMDEVMEKMSEHYKRENKIEQQVKGAMVYPMFIGVVTIVAVIIMLTFVMPTFIGLFSSAGAELPGLTQLLLNISDFIRAYWYILIVVVGGTIFMVKRYLATNIGKTQYDALLLKLPIIKGPIAKIATSRFTRTLSMLLSSGIPLLDSLNASAKSTNNNIVIKDIEEVADNVKKGIGLSTLLKKVEVFPPMMISMIKIGEESGNLEEMLDKSADFYEEELEEAIKKLTAMIEPTMIIVMAGIVGFIVIAMMLPMFDMFSAIQGA